MLRTVSVLTALFLGFGATIGLADSVPLNFSDRSGEESWIAQRRPGGSQEGWLQQLNLSQTQIQRIQSIRNQYKDRISQKRQSLKQAQQELQALMQSNAAKNQVMDKFRQVQGLRQQLEELNFNSMLDIREVLTVEQRRQLSEQMQRRKRGGSGRQNMIRMR